MSVIWKDTLVLFMPFTRTDAFFKILKHYSNYHVFCACEKEPRRLCFWAKKRRICLSINISICEIEKLSWFCVKLVSKVYIRVSERGFSPVWENLCIPSQFSKKICKYKNSFKFLLYFWITLFSNLTKEESSTKKSAHDWKKKGSLMKILKFRSIIKEERFKI